jgi:hypothetical protein
VCEPAQGYVTEGSITSRQSITLVELVGWTEGIDSFIKSNNVDITQWT